MLYITSVSVNRPTNTGKNYGGMSTDQLKELNALQKENEQDLIHDMIMLTRQYGCYAYRCIAYSTKLVESQS